MIVASLLAIAIILLMPKEHILGSTAVVAQHYLVDTSIKRQQWFNIEGYDVFLTLRDTRNGDHFVLKTAIDSVDIPQDASFYKSLVWDKTSNTLSSINGQILLNINSQSFAVVNKYTGTEQTVPGYPPQSVGSPDP